MHLSTIYGCFMLPGSIEELQPCVAHWVSIFTLRPITDQVHWSLISKRVSKEWTDKKINAILQMSLQNRKIFYFLDYTFSGLAKDQNSPLGHHLRFNLPPVSKSIVKSKIILYRMVPTMSWHLLLLWHELTGQKKVDASKGNIIKWIKKRAKKFTTRYICEGGSIASLS